MYKNRERRRRQGQVESNRARRERAASAHVRKCLDTFERALIATGKPPDEIEKLSDLYALRLNRGMSRR